ncbi:MAG TPA: efflux RND transporter permease subunit, partial [Isosphaeraceae bacterium]|nr:efflux RND transporter permease subunit [Isosphaeraceae bacterium]
DLRVRDQILRSFPEVWQVVGKAGRAETATDPAPLDMIETIINLRDRRTWPKRKLLFVDARAQTGAVLDALESKNVVGRLGSKVSRQGLIDETAMTVTVRVDEALRALATLRLAEFGPELGRALVGEAIDDLLRRVDRSAVARPISPPQREALLGQLAPAYADRLAVNVLPDDVTKLVHDAARKLVATGVLRDSPNLLNPRPGAIQWASEEAAQMAGWPKPNLLDRMADHLAAEHDRRLQWRTRQLNWELFDQAVGAATWTALEALIEGGKDRNTLMHEPSPEAMKALRAELEKPFRERLLLWQKTKADLVEEMSTALQMPGWGNSFTQPIANRIEMLATGVRSDVAVKVFGSNLDGIQHLSQEIAAVLRRIPGAVDVFPDQITGKGYVEIHIDRDKAARYGIQVGDIQDVVEVALGGKPVTVAVLGRERYPVRLRYARAFRDDLEKIKRVLVAGRGAGASSGAAGSSSGGMGAMAAGAPAAAPAGSGAPLQVPLAELAEIRIVEGPSMIKSENGLLRAYIQLNVRGRDEVGFVEEAKKVVADSVKLPPGMYIEWGGRYEHQVRAQNTLRVVFPAVIATIALILYLTHKSWIDALLMMMSVVGALAGGAIFQWLFGFNFSVAVQVGYIACFGMAVETGVVMLVYLKEAIAERGGLQSIRSVGVLREAILVGAVHRLRPKLLTEGAAIVSIAPMLWATGVGAEVIRPMAAPVLGGLLIADEVIDVFLPVLYFAVQKRRWRRLHRLGPFDDLVPAQDAAQPVALA